MLFNFTFEGNLAADPEFSITSVGKAVAKLRVGHNTRRRTNNGEWTTGPTIWVTVTAWEALAERAAKLRKGNAVIVEARNDLSVWAYIHEATQKPAGRLQVTAANIALSMRFAGATVAAVEPAVEFDPWSAETELAPAA